jgi:predicted nuclease of predicted toxin-antitoxin system
LAKLKIYTDENVDVRIAEGLKRRGIKAFSALEKGMIGASDREQFQFAADAQAVIFTHDHHFLEIALFFMEQGREHGGVIFTDMNKFSVGECIRRLALYADVLSAEEIMNRIEFL